MPHRETLPSVVVPAGEWTDLYAQTGIPFGHRIIVQNTGASDVYLATSQTVPEKTSDAYQVIRANNDQMINDDGSLGEWAFSPHQKAKLNIRRA